MSITRSYFGEGSALSFPHASSRPWALRNAFVTLSEGKIEVVTPSSAPMFVIVARSGTDSVSTPSPPPPPHGPGGPARADRHHPDAAAGGSVRVGSEQRLPGGAEPLEVHLVADAVPRPGVEDAVLRGDGLQVQVVVRVLEPFLQRVVVDVGDGHLRLHPGNAHRLELQVRHGARRVLGEGLVDPDGDLLARLLVSRYVMRVDDLLDDVLSHAAFPPLHGWIGSPGIALRIVSTVFQRKAGL